jgi:hypothetical protein
MRRTSRGVRVGIIATTVLLLAASCGDDDGVDDGAADTSAATSTTATTIDLDEVEGDEPRVDIQLVCAGGPFSPAALKSEDGLPDGIETEDSPAADALRQLLADIEGTSGRDVPDRSWRELTVVTTDDGRTIYEFANGSPPDLWVATVQELGDGGRWQGEFVEPCTPAPYLDDALVAWWWPADDAELDADTNEVDVLVQESSCDSGRGPDGRVTEPQITYGADVVVVTFGVTPREEDGVFTCQTHPPAEVTIVLDEPLGDRALVDGSTWPAHEPSEQSPTHVGTPPGDEVSG